MIVILNAWRQNAVFHQGKFYQIENFSLWMKPLQKPMPPTWVAASSDETLIKAGEMGLSIMGIPFARSSNIFEVKEKNDLLRNLIFVPAIRKIRILLLRCTFACNGARKMRLSYPGRTLPVSLTI